MNKVSNLTTKVLNLPANKWERKWSTSKVQKSKNDDCPPKLGHMVHGWNLWLGLAYSY